MKLWWRRGQAHRVTMYGKGGCHLCDDAHAKLIALARRSSIELTLVDITSDPTLFRRYDVVIPVIVIDGDKEFHAPIVWDSVRQALR